MYAPIIAILVTMFVMISATLHDIRSREVPDWHWMLLGAFAMFSAFFECGPLCGSLLSLGYFLLLLYMLSERSVGFVGFITSASSFSFLILYTIISGDSSGWVTLFTSFFILFLYHNGLIRGGADAKALVCLSMLFPVYPNSDHLIWNPIYPAGYVFNPVFSIFVLALVSSWLVIFYIFCKNLCNGRMGVSSYQMSVAEARGAFVWPLEDIKDGRKIRIKVCDDLETIYDRLEGSGEDSVLVTPMIPFLLPIAFSTAFVLLCGSPLFCLL